MAFRSVEEIEAWQLCRRLERMVFAFTATMPAKGDVKFCDAIRASAASAPRNIAEGFGRFWPGEFAHKVRIALGELRETQNDLDEASDSGYITETEYDDMCEVADRAIGAGIRLAEYLDREGPEWKKQYLKKLRDKRRRANNQDRRNGEPENAEPENAEPRTAEPKNPRTQEREP